MPLPAAKRKGRAVRNPASIPTRSAGELGATRPSHFLSSCPFPPLPLRPALRSSDGPGVPRGPFSGQWAPAHTLRPERGPGSGGAPGLWRRVPSLTPPRKGSERYPAPGRVVRLVAPGSLGTAALAAGASASSAAAAEAEARRAGAGIAVLWQPARQQPRAPQTPLRPHPHPGAQAEPRTCRSRRMETPAVEFWGVAGTTAFGRRGRPGRERGMSGPGTALGAGVEAAATRQPAKQRRPKGCLEEVRSSPAPHPWLLPFLGNLIPPVSWGTPHESLLQPLRSPSPRCFRPRPPCPATLPVRPLPRLFPAPRVTRAAPALLGPVPQLGAGRAALPREGCGCVPVRRGWPGPFLRGRLDNPRRLGGCPAAGPQIAMVPWSLAGGPWALL